MGKYSKVSATGEQSGKIRVLERFLLQYERQIDEGVRRRQGNYLEVVCNDKGLNQGNGSDHREEKRNLRNTQK